MKDENGQVNTEVKKANDLQKALSDSLNVTVGKCNERVPIILMQSGLNNNHGRALENYKQRIGVSHFSISFRHSGSSKDFILYFKLKIVVL